MQNWYDTFSDKLWLKPDSTGVEESKFIRKALHLHKGRSVLDAPCGTGRIAIHLAHAGCIVTGVDLREKFTKQAEKKFYQDNLSGRFIAMDLREMNFSDDFDAVLSWNGSFGYFSDEENKLLIKLYSKALKTGGKLLIDQPNREKMLRNFVSCMKTPDATFKNKWDPKTQRVHSDLFLHKEGKKDRNQMSIRLYTPKQLCRLLEHTGFNIKSMYGSKEGNAYSRGSARLIIVGEKS